jgi:DNA-binding NtrC family response regulator
MELEAQMAASILVIDDEQLMRDFVRETLARAGYDVAVASDGKSGMELLEKEPIDLVVTDLKMPQMDGLEVLRQVRARYPGVNVVVMTAYATVETAVSALKAGAIDYIMKPCTPDEIEVVAQKALEHRRLQEENLYLRSELQQIYNFEEIVGSGESMSAVYEQIRKVAPSRATVLICGETGTGKELVARAIHYTSPRRDKPFIKINCAALSAGLLESELFGHEKGSFTGAHQRKIGRFELANEGTLLLDEISEMNPDLQAKLLRVLQEREFERVGGSTPIGVDTRIVSTTNRNLQEAVESGAFREDLFFRLNVVPIHIPPLRDRKEDIPLLVEHFLRKYSRENGRRVADVSPEAMKMLLDHQWPGNVRELENCVERAVVLSDGGVLRREHFSFGPVPVKNVHTDGVVIPHGSTVDAAARILIENTLARCNNNRTRAAKSLGISVRTLRNKLHEYAEEEKVPRSHVRVPS